MDENERPVKAVSDWSRKSDDFQGDCEKPRFQSITSAFGFSSPIVVFMALLIPALAISVASLMFFFDVMAAPKVRTEYRPGPQPQPFFGSNSSVIDFYRGELKELEDLMYLNDVNFVMYYAPWSFECLESRSQFEMVATFYSSQVSFYAINCWEPAGLCRQERQPREFPIFQAYLQNVPTGLVYAGVVTADYMLKFVDHLISPMVRLSSDAELANFLALPTDRVIAYVGSNRQHPDRLYYLTFYYAALKMLQSDPLRKAVHFAIITQKSLADAVNLTASGQLCIFVGFEKTSKLYPADRPFKSDAVVDWLFDQVGSVSVWGNPSHKRSFALKETFKKPTLLLLAPWQVLLERSSVVSLVPQLSRLYHDCDRDPEFFNFYVKTCRSLGYSGKEVLSHKARCIGGKGARKTLVETTVGRRTDFLIHEYNGRKPDTSTCASPTLLGPESTGCPMQNVMESHNESKISVEPDPFTSDDECRRWGMAVGLNYSFVSPFADECTSVNMSSFRQRGCSSDGQLNFVTMDSDHYNWYAYKLGFPEPYSSRKVPKAMIIDSKREAFHVLLEPLTLTGLIMFVVNFTERILPKFYRSEERFMNTGAKSTETINASWSPEGATFSLAQVTADTFEHFVRGDGKNAVVLHYTKWCIFCHTVSHVVSTAAYILRSFTNVKFGQIDGSKNDLRREHAVDKYPRLALYPADRLQRVLYPIEIPLTVPNLVTFVLHHCDLETRLNIGIAFCSSQCRKRSALSVVNEGAISRGRKLRVWARLRSLSVLQRFGCSVGALKLRLFLWQQANDLRRRKKETDRLHALLLSAKRIPVVEFHDE